MLNLNFAFSSLSCIFIVVYTLSGQKYLNNCHFLPLMAQVAETHVDTWKLLQTRLKYHIFMTNNDGKL